MARGSMIPPRREVGSEFSWSPQWLRASGMGSAPSTSACELFSTGRGALISLLEMLSQNKRRPTIHLPSYFCMEVAAALAPFAKLCWYRDLPTEDAPDFQSLKPALGDFVLALNPFGFRNGTAWEAWSDRANTVLIEDHSHDPASTWARSSLADYAIASLRKTLPIPDGAALWSPKGLALPPCKPMRPAGADLKLAAMVMKDAYLQGARIPKDSFRTLQQKGEELLGGDEPAQASEFTRAVLPSIDAERLRCQRETNMRAFYEMFRHRPIKGVNMLRAVWPEGCVPYNPILVCQSGGYRDALRDHLISQGIFAAVHWRQEEGEFNSGDPSAIKLSTRLLTLPLDFRCDASQVGRVMGALAEFNVPG